MESLFQFYPAALNISSSDFTATAEIVSPSTSASLNTSRWQLVDSIEGPVIATLVGIELVLSLPLNLFIFTYSLCHWRESLNKSSTIFLFNLSLSNLLMSLFYMVFYVISTGAEEWIFGRTDYVRNILCQLHGFVFALTNSVSVNTLAVISFDRFLNIVKLDLHMKFFKWRTGLWIVVILWLFAVSLNIIPFFNLGPGMYNWSALLGGCIPLWLGNRKYVILLSVFSSFPFTLITITSSWTAIFIWRFLAQNLRRRKQTLNPENLEVQKHIYSEQVRNLTGIFGTLLVSNLFTSLPFIITGFTGLIVGLDRVPPQIYASVFVLFLFNNVTNPIIQAYFRKDLNNTIKNFLRRVMSIFKRRKAEEQEAMSRSGTTDTSLETSPGIGSGEHVERGVCELTTVLEEGEEVRRGRDSSRNGSHLHPSSFPLRHFGVDID